MKDLHTHVLPGIDDGCRTIDESMQILNALASSGVTELVFTPHYIENSNFICNVSKKQKLFEKIKKQIKKENINIKVYTGNEIYFTENILKLLKENEMSTINSSRYLLIELPVLNYPNNAKNVFSELIYSGYKIILAHPERYYYVIDDIHILDDLIKMGVLMQGDYASLYGRYGKKSKRTLKKLLKKGYISFLCSDTHHKVEIKEKKLKRKLRWYLSKEDIEKTLNTNFDKVIKDENI